MEINDEKFPLCLGRKALTFSLVENLNNFAWFSFTVQSDFIPSAD